jgi:hypothetical protein
MQVSECVVHDAVFSGRGVPKTLFDSVQNCIPGSRDSVRQLGRIGFQEGRFVEWLPVAMAFKARHIAKSCPCFCREQNANKRQMAPQEMRYRPTLEYARFCSRLLALLHCASAMALLGC